ncbi:MAG TPA: alanine racemase [Acidimicrobiales bacterium]|jgi:alanine racemase|nr:alanine racemase [Acidimicrobiales bacterium]
MGARPAWAEVDLGAIRHNAALLAALAAPAGLCAVVKAAGYGHGSVPVARAAIEGGATWLAVALVEEGAVLRGHGLDAPVLLLSEPPVDSMGEVVALGLTPTVYTHEGVEAAAKAAAAAGTGPLAVHVKVDTGMHRVGASPSDAPAVVQAVVEHPELTLGGVWTHFAVADEPDHPFTTQQCGRFQAVLDDLDGRGVRPPLVHAANSAGALAHPGARFDLVRCGIALYGVSPSPALAALEPVTALRPALSLRARVSFVKRVGPGEAVSYGLRRPLQQEATIATVPVGYADGVPWRLGVSGGEVLIGGRRRALAGSVTMDQILVDCGDDTGVLPGDEVVLLGRQGTDEISAWDWAGRTGTIAYEILCGIGPRVPKIYG